MSGVTTPNRWLLLFSFACIALSSDAATPEQRLEQIKRDGKSRPREAILEIDAWLAERPSPTLALREQLITTKAFNLMMLSDNEHAQQ